MFKEKNRTIDVPMSGNVHEASHREADEIAQRDFAEKHEPVKGGSRVFDTTSTGEAIGQNQ